HLERPLGGEHEIVTAPGRDDDRVQHLELAAALRVRPLRRGRRRRRCRWRPRAAWPVFRRAPSPLRTGNRRDTDRARQRGDERKGPPEPEASRRALVLPRRQQSPEALTAFAELSREPRL